MPTTGGSLSVEPLSESLENPIQVRNHEDTGTRTDEGSYLKSDMPIAGFALIEANNVDEAVELVAKTPPRLLTEWSRCGR